MALPAYASPLQRVWHYAFRVLVGLILFYLIAPILVIIPLSFNAQDFFTFTPEMLAPVLRRLSESLDRRDSSTGQAADAAGGQGQTLEPAQVFQPPPPPARCCGPRTRRCCWAATRPVTPTSHTASGRLPWTCPASAASSSAGRCSTRPTKTLPPRVQGEMM